MTATIVVSIDKSFRSKFVFLIVFVICFSCSKNGDPITSSSTTTLPEIPKCQLTKRSIAYLQGTTLITATSIFTYNPDGTLKNITTTDDKPGVISKTSSDFSYTSGMISKVNVTYTYGSSVSSDYYTWINENGRLIRIDQQSDYYTASSFYLYDGKSNLLGWSYKRPIDTFTSKEYTVQIDANGNVKSDNLIQRFLAKVNDPTSLYFYSTSFTNAVYDSKKNPYSLLAKTMRQPVFFSYELGALNADFISKNNFQSADATGDYYKRVSRDLEYNSQDYLVKYAEKRDGVVLRTTIFEYDKCD